MTGYVRKDTTNNIADGNVINAADLDSEFDGVQDAFNASTGHKHDGTAGEGATINALGPTQDVTVSSTLLAPKTTNTVDIGSSALKFKDLFLAGNGSVGGTLAVTGVATFTAQPILSSLTASRAVFSDGSKGLVSNAITGTGNVVMSASPTLTGTVGGASLTLSSLTAGRVTYAGTSGLLQDSANLTFNGTTLTANTLSLTNALATTSGGTGLTSFTSGGVVYASSTSALATGSALTFDGTNLGLGTPTPAQKFHVNSASGSVYTLISSGANNLYLGYNSGSTLGVIESNNSLAFNVGSSYAEALRITSTSLYTASGINVGIGTSNPTDKLTIVGNQKITGYIELRSANKIYFDDSGNTAAGAIWNGGTAAGLSFGGDGSTQHMILNNSGNLGLGVTPSAWSDGPVMQVGGIGIASRTALPSLLQLSANQYWDGANHRYIASNYATIYSQHLGGHIWSSAASGTAGAIATFTAAMTLDASGNLGIGTTSPSTKLQVNDTITIGTADKAIQWLNSGTALADIRADSSSNLIFRNTSSYSERARIDSSGNLLVGTTSTAYSGQVVSNANGAAIAMYALNNTDTGSSQQTIFDIYRNGTRTGSISHTNALTIYSTTSDYRLKTVIGAVTGQGARIDALEPIEYTWTANGSCTRGFLAHKFQEVYADSVSGTKDAVDANGNPLYQGMQAATSEVIADLVAEIQSLRQRVAQLETN
jgi:hypothetical protein